VIGTDTVGGVLGTPHGLVHLLWVVSALESWQEGGPTHLGPPALSLWALSRHRPHPRRGEGRGSRWSGLPAFAFAEVVLAIVLVVIAFGGGFRGSWRPFGFASADH
jgi:hypothetical protein